MGGRRWGMDGIDRFCGPVNRNLFCYSSLERRLSRLEDQERPIISISDRNPEPTLLRPTTEDTHAHPTGSGRCPLMLIMRTAPHAQKKKKNG